MSKHPQRQAPLTARRRCDDVDGSGRRGSRGGGKPLQKEKASKSYFEVK